MNGCKKTTIIEQSDLRLEQAKKENAKMTDQAEIEQTSTTEDDEEEEEIDEDALSPEELIAYKVDKRVESELEHEKDIAKEVKVFTQGSYLEATIYRAEQSLTALAITPMFATFVCLPLFMIGYWLVASERLKKPENHQAFFNVMCWGGLLLGLMLNIAGTFLVLHPVAKAAVEISAVGETIIYYGQLILAAGYVGLFVKLAQKARFLNFFSWLAPLGKMALTNYIMHSVILTSIFYGYAGGMFGQIARSQQMLLIVAIIFCQVFFCKFWLKYFKFGPLEWLWRSMTYLKLQPLKVTKVTPASSSNEVNI